MHGLDTYSDIGGRVQRTPCTTGEEDGDGLKECYVWRGEYLVHFAGRGERGEVLSVWIGMLENVDDTWEKDRVQRCFRRGGGVLERSWGSFMRRV
jgi:hypothetical protein